MSDNPELDGAVARLAAMPEPGREDDLLLRLQQSQAALADTTQRLLEAYKRIAEYEKALGQLQCLLLGR